MRVTKLSIQCTSLSCYNIFSEVLKTVEQIATRHIGNELHRHIKRSRTDRQPDYKVKYNKLSVTEWTFHM